MPVRGLVHFATLALAATSASGIDDSLVRQWLASEVNRATESKYGHCLDITWTRSIAPQLSDKEFSERWANATGKPDHPDQHLLRMEAASRRAEVLESWRVLIESPRVMRISAKRPMAGLLPSGQSAPLSDFDNASKISHMQQDVAVSGSTLWQSSDDAIAVMTEGDGGDFDPTPLLRSARFSLDELLFAGLGSLDPALIRGASVVRLDENRFELSMTARQAARTVDWKLQVVWDTRLSRGFVVERSVRGTTSATIHVQVDRFFEWTQATGTSLYFPAYHVRSASTRSPVQPATALREVFRTVVQSATSTDCDLVTRAAGVPAIIEQVNGFSVTDPLRGDWTLRGVMNFENGTNRYVNDSGVINQERLKTSSMNAAIGSQQNKRNSSLVYPVGIAVCIAVIGVGAWIQFRRHKFS
jgi:hypothetical protein